MKYSTAAHITIISAIILSSTVFSIIGCEEPRGNWHQECKKDGTCNSKLVCGIPINSYYTLCVNESEINKPGDDCRGNEDQKFCCTCAKTCGTQGVSRCDYSDPTVWGSKPALCQCNIVAPVTSASMR